MKSLEKQANHNEESRDSEALEAMGKEHREHLKQELEHAAATEVTSERDQDTASAQLEALKQAKNSEELKTHHKRESSPAERRGPIGKKQLDARFKHTMKAVQEDLSPSSRAFSKFIHIKSIEKASDIIGSTIARPNALLAGAIGAFALTLAIYIFAKNMGYKLSGFEPIAAFAIGWFLGLLYDYFRVMITGKKS